MLPLWQVLCEEYEKVRPAWRDELAQVRALRSEAGKDAADDAKLARLLQIVHAHAKNGDGLVGVSLSGGGIRSATFNLGVLQGLARIGVLGAVDYLSSVSGGGFIAGWLHGWIYRAGGLDRVVPELRGALPDPAHPEAEPITHLRQYSNYLTPRVGALSADTWTGAAIVLRNLILNLTVLVPVLAAALALPLVAVSRPLWLGRLAPGPDYLYGAAVLLAGIAFYFMSLLRASARPLHDRRKPPPFLWLGLAPLLVATPLVLLAVAQFQRPANLLPLWGVAVRCLLWSIVVPMIALAVSVPRQRRAFGRQRSSLRVDLSALLFSGAIEAAIYFGILKKWVPLLLAAPYDLYEILGPALVLGPMLLGKSLFIAFSSVAGGARYPSELGDADREWWARWSGWILLTGVLWTLAGAFVFLGPLLLHSLRAKVTTAIAAGGLGGVVRWLGKTAGSAASPAKQGGDGGSPLKKVALALAAPLFAIALLLLISVATQGLMRALPKDWTGATGSDWEAFRGYTVFLLAAIAVLFAIGTVMGHFVNVNRFSLQAIFRNRLVRAYLGASNRRRRPNLFTGFDPNDNLRLHALRDNRPLPLINMTLNLVGGEDLAWQQRKAENFTATPLHCGSACLGYRRAQIYGGHQGISLGTAVATSGAAANPSMGEGSSPALGFLMTVFNVRLGIWLGNPGPLGGATYTRSGPANSGSLLVDEALGFTDARHPYVNLSDGGHFENLGLYEMVRRRCRFIVIGDGGCDPTYVFNDLGNAIRKIRVDFGISIEFRERVHIFPKTPVNPAGRYCAVGAVHYKDVDGMDAPDGTIVYVKPAICDTEPYDVTNYASSSRDFPHETTADQWFNESQFESYRALGRETILTMVRKDPPLPLPLSLEQFLAQVKEYVQKGAPP